MGRVAHHIEPQGRQDRPCRSIRGEGPDDLRGIINLLHAPPPDDPYYNVWAAFWTGGTPDRAKIVTPGYRPRLLGTSPQEIAWHLYDGYRRILSATRQRLVGTIACLYSGMPHKGPKWQQHWDPMVVVPAQVLADVYHSCLCVAFDRIDPAQLAELARVRIESTHPAEVPLRLAPPYDYVPVARDVALDAQRKPHPLVLRMADGPRPFEHGFSTGSARTCRVSYIVPAQVFERFTGWVGLHPELVGRPKPGKVKVEVLLDGQTVMQTGALGPDSRAQRIDVPIAGGGKLELVSHDPTGSAGAVVWADTVLVRRAKAPVTGKLPDGWKSGPAKPRRESVRLPERPFPAWGPAGRARIAAAALGALPKPDRVHVAEHRSRIVDTVVKPGEEDKRFPRPGTDLTNYKAIAAPLEHYVAGIARALKSRNRREAAELAGVLVSVVADRACPVTCLDGQGGPAYRAFAQLFPAPPGAPFANAASGLAQGLDAVQPDLSGYKPRLLGTSPAEAAFRARQAYVRMVQSSGYGLTALVEARYAKDDARAATMLNEIAAAPARLVADLLHTCVCLAEGRYEPAETRWLETLDLTQACWQRKPGYAGGPYRTQPIVYGFSLKKEGRQKVPLELRLVKDGREQVRTFQRGLGVGGHAKWAFAFTIPPKVFGKLDIHLGMHATLGHVASYGKTQGEMQLQIALGKKLLYDSGVITPKVPGAHAVVDTSAGGRLELRMADRSGHWANYGNQVVYGEPVLVRSPDAPRGLD